MRRFCTVLIITVVFALSGCHTAKKATEPVINNSNEVVVDEESSDYAYLSRRLGIEINKRDKSHIKLFSTVEKWLGVPYRYGGNTTAGCDCSGFVTQVYKSVYGKLLERNSAGIKSKNCRDIKRGDLRTGDLVFFKTGSAGRINHVGIYLKDGKFIHASTSRGVIVSDLEERYYQKTYDSSGRVD